MSRNVLDPRSRAGYRFWLIWCKEGEEEYLARTVQPLTISRGGIVLHLRGPAPSKDCPVWVTLGEDVPDMSLFLAAELIESKQEHRGEHELRLAFQEPCPEDFYRAVTRGITPVS